LTFIFIFKSASGVEINKMPSSFAMMRLLVNSEIRSAFQKVQSEMEKAGIDLQSTVRFWTGSALDSTELKALDVIGSIRRDNATTEGWFWER
jgi:hypothetical protein